MVMQDHHIDIKNIRGKTQNNAIDRDENVGLNKIN